MLIRILFLLLFLCWLHPGTLTAQNISPFTNNADVNTALLNQSIAAYRTTVGVLGESFMDHYFELKSSGGWEKIPSKIGPQGIDGLYVRRNRAGVITDVQVVESKYGTSALSNTKYGMQMSHEWVNKKIADLMKINERQIEQCIASACNNLTVLQAKQKDLSVIKRYVSQEDSYRRRLFRTDISEGKLNLVFSDIDNTNARPRTISLKYPPSKAGELELYNLFYKTVKDELTGHGLPNRIANNATEEIKRRFSSGNISNRRELQNYLINRIYDYKIAHTENPVAKSMLRCMKVSLLLNNKVPNSLNAPANAAILAGLLSAGGHGYKMFLGEESALDAASAFTSDSIKAGLSMYAAEAVIQYINGKIVLTVFLSDSIKKALGAGARAGVAVFIFDEAVNIYAFAKGELTENQFITRTSRSLINSAASGAAAYCAVLLNANPVGLTVTAVAIGTYLAVDTTLSYCEKIQQRHYLAIEDLLWQLPIGIKYNKTLADLDIIDSHSILESKTKDHSILDSEHRRSSGIIGSEPENRSKKNSILSY